MTFYEQIVTETQMKNYSRNYMAYQRGGTAVKLSELQQLPYEQQVEKFIQLVKDADCIIVGAASGLSSAGGGDFYYEDNESYRKYFGKFAEKYHLKGAFSGMIHPWESREEFWGYLATFLHTTQTAPLRKPYEYLDEIIKDKDFFVLTTNQDTQFTRIYPAEKLAEIQGDHRFFQCSRPCCDDVWDALEPVKEMMESMGDGTSVATDKIPRCPHCGAEAFPWVRGYGNFLTGRKYQNEYRKISEYILDHKEEKILFIELGVGRITPMFIQEPFWLLTESLPKTSYISVNKDYAFLPKAIEDRGMVIQGDINSVLEDVARRMKG